MSESGIDKLIRGCQKGDREAFGTLVEMYSGRCFGYFYRLSGQREISEDLLSELFVKLVEKIQLYRGPSFEPWLFTIAANVWHDYLRGKQKRQKVLEAAVKDADELVVENRDDDERIDTLQKALGMVDDQTRELMVMRFSGQMSFKEISEARGEPIGTTLSKVHRGLKKLREIINAQR
ncbi:MAG: sigma-70 family RNA polymerase sigma factor [Phycisphaerae bacterium]|nr:sigma-70 family RNA polymerase sigma factor [Phycisphaerae bacterium]